MGRVTKIEFPVDPDRYRVYAAGTEIPFWHGHFSDIFDILYVEAKGHPTDAISEAHRIGQFVLGEHPWHIVHIELTSPMRQQLKIASDDKWIAKVWMQRKS